MKSEHIKFDDDTIQFLNDYKQSHGVSKQAFIEMAVKKEIINIKAELKLREHVNTK